MAEITRDKIYMALRSTLAPVSTPLGKGQCQRLRGQTGAIMKLLDDLAEPEPRMAEAVIGVSEPSVSIASGMNSNVTILPEIPSQLSPRAAAYALGYQIAIQSGYGQYTPELLDERAKKIGNAIGGFSTTKDETINLHFSATTDIESFRRTGASLKAALDTIPHYRFKEPNDWQEAKPSAALQREVDRNFWRREGWDDCKKVMARMLDRQIKNPNGESWVLNLTHSYLLRVKRFVASFTFDPDMP